MKGGQEFSFRAQSPRLSCRIHCVLGQGVMGVMGVMQGVWRVCCVAAWWLCSTLLLSLITHRQAALLF